MTRSIMLTQDKVALVSDEDYDRLTAFTWYAEQHKYGWYAARSPSRVNGQKIAPVRMHVEIMRPDSDLEVDHRDGDGLNNQRSNLRVCQRTNNRMNQHHPRSKTGYKGVRAHRGKFETSTFYHGKNIYLGRFSAIEAAAKAYNKFALDHYGEFAWLNKTGRDRRARWCS